MIGFITLAVGNRYLQMAAAFALSARRFGYPTILLYRNTDVSALADFFHRVVDLTDCATVNVPDSGPGIWELKKYCYEKSADFSVCAFCDADSLVIRDPYSLFQMSEQLSIHTPGARVLNDDEKWAHPPEFAARQIATEVGLPPDTPIQTLNGGFLMWKRGPQADAWFRSFRDLFQHVHDVYRRRLKRAVAVREELCMSLAFALHGIELPRSDSSIGIWDAQRLVLDIQREQFECRKGFYWEGHDFRPYIAHFGGRRIDARYQECVAFLTDDACVDLSLFAANEPRGRHRGKGTSGPSFNSFSISPEEYQWLRGFVRENGIRKVLEFGPGTSTWAFLEAGCQIVSLEYQDKWYRHYRREFAEHPQVTILRYDNDPELQIPELDDCKFDLAFVDSPVGKLGVLYKRFARINSCEYVASRTDTWILHDARREGERNTLSVFEDKGWSVEVIDKGAGMAIARRDSSHVGATPALGGLQADDCCQASLARLTRDYDHSHWDRLPKVSCQCITYGRTQLLDEAVESFLLQDYPGDKELVILNDCPNLRIECELPEIRVINLPYRMKTIGEKRNACVALCTGEIIFPWDDDDIHLPHRISYSLQQMTNHRYYKSDSLWFWKNGEVSPEPKKAVAHAMGCWSVEFFDEVGGYPHIQSGQDMALEELFKGPSRYVEQTRPEDIYYIYRFPGTGSYHLSACGYGKGYEQVESFVKERAVSGTHIISPTWRQDYLAMVDNAVSRLRICPKPTAVGARSEG